MLIQIPYKLIILFTYDKEFDLADIFQFNDSENVRKMKDDNYNIQMQGTIIKELGKFPNLNSELADYLKRLMQNQLAQSLSLPASKNIVSTLIQSTCQTRNLLHYKHVDDRTTAQKCFLLINDLLNRLIIGRPLLLQHIANEFLVHILQHPTCFISFAFFLMIARKHIVQLRQIVSSQRLRKVLTRVISNFQEAGEIQFLGQLGQIDKQQSDLARNELQKFLNKKVKYNKVKKQNEQINVSLSKIPPLILPSSKSIHSSRYSAISREQRTKGISQMRQLASAIGQSFVAVELGCLLAHKRTQQVQQFFDNSDYRSRCLQKIYTDRLNISQLSIRGNTSFNQNKSNFDCEKDQTTLRYLRKVLVVTANLIHLFLEPQLSSPNYTLFNFKPFYLDFITVATVGIIDPWRSDSQFQITNSTQYFNTINLQLLPIRVIMKQWGERVSFLTQKKHLKMLMNRNKKNGQFFYEQELVNTEVNDDFLSNFVGVIRNQHTKMFQGTLKHIKKQEKYQSDFILNEISHKLNQLFSLCDMNNNRFYKYQTNILGVLASYLHNSFSNTVQYLAIDILFPIILLIKRQILELSHPYLDMLQAKNNLNCSKKFAKKQKIDTNKISKVEQPLFVTYPDLFSNFLVVISGLISNHKHVQKLISTIFIKNSIFMETLEKYTKYLFQENKNEQIKKVLIFYRKCMQIYNQRKLRNQQSKSIKMLFNHLSIFFYPKIGCIANKLEEKQFLISSSPQLDQRSIEQHHFMHQILDFLRQIYYYCQDELSQTLLEEEVVSFYLKYSFINFIKLYSSITVNQLINLQSQHNELTTKESPHVSYHPSINTIYMIDFIRIITSISINRNQEISKKIKQYRILQFFIREFELQFQVAENIQKYIKKVIKIMDVPTKLKAPPLDKNKNQTIPPLNFKSQKTKAVKQSSPVKQPQKNESKSKKNDMKVPMLKLPGKSDRSQGKGVLDGLISEINQKPKKLNLQLNLQLTKLNLQKSLESNHIAKSSQRNLIYTSQRKIRKIYSNKTLHSQAILLVLSLLLNKGLLDPQYCDQFPITHGKINALYILHHHFNQQSNMSVIPILAESVSKIKPYLAGQRLLKLLSTKFTDLSHYKEWKKISAGAYGVIYGCETNIEQPREVAIKEMSFPKSIYERCVLHDIFTQISCLENFRLDERITTMYNYGVVSNAYIIVMKKYDCSLRDWILQHKDNLHGKFKIILKIFWDVLNIILLLHQKSVTHYDIKADNILLTLDESTRDPVKVVLGDFGQCRIYDQSKQQLDMKSRGTECIKSPQMLTLALHLKKQADNYDRRKKIGTTRASDIWSLGCLFYQLLTSDYLYHRADWVNFYIQVTSHNQQIITKQNIAKLQRFNKFNQIYQLLKVILVRDPQHRPQIKGLIQKFKDLFKNQIEQNPPPSKSPLIIQKDLEVLVNKYIDEIKKNQGQKPKKTINSEQSQLLKPHYRENKIRGVKFINSYNQSKNNKFMRIMQDIFFCENINLQQGGYQKIKQLKITHIVTTSNHPLLKKFNTLFISFKNINLPNIAFRLAPKISDFLRQVLLLKGRLLFINDQTNYGTNLLIYTLSYWFRCSVYETWCLINTQILLFPTFTSDLLSLSCALRLLNQVQECVQQLPKLQCICGTVTIILKDFSKVKKKGDLSCKCKRKKINEYNSLANGPQCINVGCQQYLQFVKKRYSISWQSIKWSNVNTSNLLTTVFNTKKIKDVFKTQIILNSAQPYQNMVQIGSCVKTCKVYSCKLCEMLILATTENKDQYLIVMNNMLRRIRQGIMIPNAQESFAKKTPALTYYTLTKLHMTKGPEE